MDRIYHHDDTMYVAGTKVYVSSKMTASHMLIVNVLKKSKLKCLKDYSMKD